MIKAHHTKKKISTSSKAKYISLKTLAGPTAPTGVSGTPEILRPTMRRSEKESRLKDGGHRRC